MSLDAAFFARIDNWVRWSRSNSTEPHDHCGSAEWRYQGETGNVYEQQAPAIPSDPLDAAKVEAAWRKCSRDAKFLLKHDLHQRRPPGWILRKLGRGKEAYKTVKFSALLELSKMLDNSKSA